MYTLLEIVTHPKTGSLGREFTGGPPGEEDNDERDEDVEVPEVTSHVLVVGRSTHKDAGGRGRVPNNHDGREREVHHTHPEPVAERPRIGKQQDDTRDSEHMPRRD